MCVFKLFYISSGFLKSLKDVSSKEDGIGKICGSCPHMRVKRAGQGRAGRGRAGAAGFYCVGTS